ncbi:unnamed protein product [Plutella xylostella]|uniref:(diamondback moth) hypothetical protein n=1 Tax=Plutella xylostella TaxID=51655 RepID=A0A8S4G0T8_PLUXY|nr:unnamed protein product [Plutella xylostella]
MTSTEQVARQYPRPSARSSSSRSLAEDGPRYRGSSSGSPGARAGRRSSLALTPEDEPLVDVAVMDADDSKNLSIFCLRKLQNPY